jgi:hypothetical protein
VRAGTLHIFMSIPHGDIYRQSIRESNVTSTKATEFHKIWACQVGKVGIVAKFLRILLQWPYLSGPFLNH